MGLWLMGGGILPVLVIPELAHSLWVGRLLCLKPSGPFLCLAVAWEGALLLMARSLPMAVVQEGAPLAA